MTDIARQWDVTVERVQDTPTSVLMFGTRAGTPVVLKVLRRSRDEQHAGDVLAAFGGRGAVRLLAQREGALLLEQLQPGRSLITVVDEDDDRATRIIAEVIGRMDAHMAAGVPTARVWAASFSRYSPGDAAIVSADLAGRAARLYSDLCDSQRAPRLLHGDLHHDNVLLDAHHGWVAIDPKGVIAEREFEIGAALRNPIDRPHIFTDRATIRRRVVRYADDLRLDPARIVAWAWAQAVLATVWLIEDGEPVLADHPWLTLAHHLESILADVGAGRPI